MEGHGGWLEAVFLAGSCTWAFVWLPGTAVGVWWCFMTRLHVTLLKQFQLEWTLA